MDSPRSTTEGAAACVQLGPTACAVLPACHSEKRHHDCSSEPASVAPFTGWARGARVESRDLGSHLACHTWPRLQSRRPSTGRCEGQTHAALRAESHPPRREAPVPALPAETPSAERPLQANPPSQSPHCAEGHPVSLARGHPLATSAQTQLCTIATTPLTWTSPHVRVRAHARTHSYTRRAGSIQLDTCAPEGPSVVRGKLHTAAGGDISLREPQFFWPGPPTCLLVVSSCPQWHPFLLAADAAPDAHALCAREVPRL